MNYIKKIFLFTFLFSSLAYAEAWKCGKLDLEFVEIPNGPSETFSLDGCYNPNTFFLISSDCKKDPKKCIANKSKKPLDHPGGQFGSPAFVKCYKQGGKPRFVRLKVNETWENTSTCFFGSREHFIDYDTLSENI